MECGIDLIVPINRNDTDTNASINVQLGIFKDYKSFNNNMLYLLANNSYWKCDERYDSCFTIPINNIQGTTIILTEIDKETIRNAHDLNDCADEKPYAFIKLNRVRHNIVMLKMLRAEYMNFIEFMKSLEKGMCNNYFEIVNALENGEYEVDLANAKIRYWYEQYD